MASGTDFYIWYIVFLRQKKFYQVGITFDVSF